MFCVRCGSATPETSRFCPQCGVSVSAPPAVAATTMEPPRRTAVPLVYDGFWHSGLQHEHAGVLR